MNQATFIGNLIAQAEQKQSQGGTCFITFSIAVNRKYKDKEENALYRVHQEWRQRQPTPLPSERQEDCGVRARKLPRLLRQEQSTKSIPRPSRIRVRIT